MVINKNRRLSVLTFRIKINQDLVFKIMINMLNIDL